MCPALAQQYSRAELLDINRELHRLSSEISIPPEIHSLPSESSASTGRQRRRCERKQKRGKRAGVRARLKANPSKPPLPSIFLANVRSIRNKLDEIRLRLTAQRTLTSCCCMIFTETWLDSTTPDAAIQLAGRTVYRADRTADSGKKSGGGLCVFLNNCWCTNASIVEKYCCPELELMLLKCRPFYLPREFGIVFICAVYIPPDANAKLALAQLHVYISKRLATHPDSAFIVAGDFNRANLRSVLPTFHPNVTCATRGSVTLDQVYTNVVKAYKVQSDSHLGLSDHLSLFLYPSYQQRIKATRPATKSITVWNEDAIPQLQDCFDSTDWTIFNSLEAPVDPKRALEEYTSSVMDYINFCVNNVTRRRTVRVFPNQKPWMCREVRTLLKARDAAYRSGDAPAYSVARAALRRGIKSAKAKHRQRVEQLFHTHTNPRQVWEGIRAISDYKGTASSPPSSCATLSEELNQFYARFDRDNTGQLPLPLPSDAAAPTLSPHEVRLCLKTINPRKAAGPDGVAGRVLRNCGDQLTEVFTDIFNRSLALSHVPPCFKASTIIPVPKKTAVTCLNDYRPVALTPIPAKCLERLVMKHIRGITPASFDQHQFAYKANRSTEDAVALLLHTALEHLELKNTYIRILFIDYSSAFNTILPGKLISKLQDLNLSATLCNWVLDFLTNRTQRVQLGKHHSSNLTISTGAPQGCVLSPLLYTLYTHDCTPSCPSNYIFKFADDTTVLGLISNNDEAAYRQEVGNLAAWCSEHNLSLNLKKTKEMIIDFRKSAQHNHHLPLYINGEEVERVTSFKFLGLTLTEELSWENNTASVLGKAQQRLFYLRKLRKEHLPQRLLSNFYRCAIESVLTYCLNVWFSSCTKAEQAAIQRLIKTAGRIIGAELPDIYSISSSRCLQRSNRILTDPSHPAHYLFPLLPSGKRFRSTKARTSRMAKSFYPRAIRLLNSSPKTTPPPPRPGPARPHRLHS